MSCSDWLILGWILDSSMGQAVGTVKPRSYRACLEHSRNDKEVRVVGGKWIRGWVAENEVMQWQGSDRVGSYLKEMGSSCKILRRLAWSTLYFKRIPLAVVIEADCRGAKVNTERPFERLVPLSSRGSRGCEKWSDPEYCSNSEPTEFPERLDLYSK